MDKKIDEICQTGQQDRRRKHDRRIIHDRRSNIERRRDFRENPNGQPRSLRIWLRSLVNSRLGVDRRKRDRRHGDRRRLQYNDVLTPEEIAELFSQ